MRKLTLSVWPVWSVSVVTPAVVVLQCTTTRQVAISEYTNPKAVVNVWRPHLSSTAFTDSLDELPPECYRYDTTRCLSPQPLSHSLSHSTSSTLQYSQLYTTSD